MSRSEAKIRASSRLKVLEQPDSALWRVSLDGQRCNIIDAAMVAELSEVFLAAAAEPRLKAIVLSAEGLNFSFGASVEEHQADQVRGMLAGFHGLLRSMATAGVPVIAAVRGRCLGGGLELVAFCQRVIAHPEASFGQPEIALGVFAPVGSAILAERVGRGAADDLLLSGRSVKAPEAREMRLVDQLDEAPESAAMDWAQQHLLPRSASSLRIATRAARLAFNRRFERDIEELEQLYLDRLMATRDANEGIAAFLEKRKPVWVDA